MLMHVQSHAAGKHLTTGCLCGNNSSTSCQRCQARPLAAITWLTKWLAWQLLAHQEPVMRYQKIRQRLLQSGAVLALKTGIIPLRDMQLTRLQPEWLRGKQLAQQK